MREQRINAAELRLRGSFWLLAIALWVILIGLSAAIEPLAYHTVSITAQGFAIAFLAALVFRSDRPFRGDTSKQPDALERMIVLMKERT